VIFVTAFSEFAVLAFRYNALDYLLKPISIAELNEAVSKIQDKVSGGYLTEDELNFLIENMRKKAEDKQLVIRNSDGITYIKVTDIVRCEGDGNYTTLFLAKEKKVVASKPLREYDTILPSTMFFRVHQTHLINLNFIKKFTRNDGAVVLIDNTHIPVARRRKQEFLAKLDSAN
jgi:two-component system LytT family response regulator